MAVDRTKFAYSVVTELKKGKLPNAEQYGLSKADFGYLIKDIRDNYGLIENAWIANAHGEPRIVDLSKAQVTLKGEEFLSENSKLKKAYGVTKELREWVNTVVSIVKP